MAKHVNQAAQAQFLQIKQELTKLYLKQKFIKYRF